MKTIILIALIGLTAVTNSLVASTNVLSVAVFDFESKDEAVRDLGSKVGTLLNAFLSTSDGIILVERADLEKVSGEQELGLSGTVSTETAAKVGHLTGAKVLVTGRVFRVDKNLMLVAKVIGTETSRVYGEMVKGPPTASIDDLVSELAQKISGTISGRTDSLVAKVPPRQDRIEALKTQLKDSPRPAVSVSIAERHFGGPGIDPAAQTELGLILQQCGFTLVDEKSAQKADVEISGEAFSAFGLRRGNLISCKARLEMKAQRMSDGKIVAVDRQTSVAVDIAEQIAAKTALQQAAAELASRLIPQLVEIK